MTIRLLCFLFFSSVVLSASDPSLTTATPAVANKPLLSTATNFAAAKTPLVAKPPAIANACVFEIPVPVVAVVKIDQLNPAQCRKSKCLIQDLVKCPSYCASKKKSTIATPDSPFDALGNLTVDDFKKVLRPVLFQKIESTYFKIGGIAKALVAINKTLQSPFYSMANQMGSMFSGRRLLAAQPSPATQPNPFAFLDTFANCANLDFAFVMMPTIAFDEALDCAAQLAKDVNCANDATMMKCQGSCISSSIMKDEWPGCTDRGKTITCANQEKAIAFWTKDIENELGVSNQPQASMSSGLTGVGTKGVGDMGDLSDIMNMFGSMGSTDLGGVVGKGGMPDMSALMGMMNGEGGGGMPDMNTLNAIMGQMVQSGQQLNSVMGQFGQGGQMAQTGQMGSTLTGRTGQNPTANQMGHIPGMQMGSTQTGQKPTANQMGQIPGMGAAGQMGQTGQMPDFSALMGQMGQMGQSFNELISQMGQIFG